MAGAVSAAIDDRTIASDIARGDRTAFETLMRRYNRRLYRLARATLRDSVEAEDALQDAYLLAFRSMGKFRGEASLSTWLSRLVLNECLGRIRRRARRENVIPMVSADIELTRNCVDESESPDTALARVQVRGLLERRVDELPDAFRTVFVMRSVEDLSVGETAVSLGIAEETVRSRHFRAKSLLRAALEAEFGLAECDLFEFGGLHCDRIVARVLARLGPDTPAPGLPAGATGCYSSPACYLHEFATAMTSWEAIRDWRRQSRRALITKRLELSVHERRARGEKARQRLLDLCDLSRYAILGVYWPMRGEIDIRDLARSHIDAGGMIGLPVVVEKSAPVEFWRWLPGMKMRRDIWNIPIPTQRVVLTPDALIVPLVGFDAGRYRLGYGGGYYDRTIASAAKRPFCIGLGYADSALDTIYPQAHDIPMDLIVTDD